MQDQSGESRAAKKDDKKRNNGTDRKMETNSSREERDSRSNNRGNSTKYSTPCEYEKEGRCIYGRKCWFSHEPEGTNKQHINLEKKKVQWPRQHIYCKYEETREGCRFGPKRCWYEHRIKDKEMRKNEEKKEDNRERNEKKPNRHIQENQDFEKETFLGNRVKKHDPPENWTTTWV